MSLVVRFPDYRSDMARFIEQTTALLNNAEESYTHLNDVFLHLTHNEDGSVTMSKTDYDALRATARLFWLTSNKDQGQ